MALVDEAREALKECLTAAGIYQTALEEIEDGIRMGRDMTCLICDNFPMMEVVKVKVMLELEGFVCDFPATNELHISWK
jgi:hypothetical protein